MRRTRITTPQARAQFAGVMRNKLMKELQPYAGYCKVESTIEGIYVLVFSDSRTIASAISIGVRVINELAQDYDWCFSYGEVRPTEHPGMLTWAIPVNYTLDDDDRED